MVEQNDDVHAAENEVARLRTLNAFGIIDTSTEKIFDDLSRLAAIICETPIALISFVEKERQWFKASYGFDVKETSREVSFCAKALHEPDIFVVEDATEDDRFALNPLVTGDPNIRFYAGAQLVVSNGQPLGTLCVIDRKPKQLTDQQAEALGILRQAVVSQLELRRAIRDIAHLESFVPMCAWCRSIKTEQGNWVDPHEFVMSSNRVTHGMCPKCFAS